MTHPQKKLTMPPESLGSSSRRRRFDNDNNNDDDATSVVVDLDQMTKTLSSIKSKNIRPDLLPSVISHYASKWLPDVLASPAGSTAALIKKRLFIETLIGLLPPEKDAMPCDFLSKILRAACMVGAAPAYLEAIETRVAYRLDRASLEEVMVPAFRHTCGTLLDVGLFLKLVKKFATSDEGVRTGAAMMKVAKLVDSYLAEAAVDVGLTVADFEEVAKVLPGHVRTTDDGLYRAVDTYIKTHPGLGKQERKSLCRLIDTRKLTSEASLHAIHNDRLPIRSVIQVLFSEQSKLSRITEGSSGYLITGPRSPSLGALDYLPGRCPSKREAVVQQQEVRKLRDDVARLQAQCRNLQAQVDRIPVPVRKSTAKKGFFNWSGLLFWNADSVEKVTDDYEVSTPRTPTAAKETPTKWRNSLS